MWKKAIWTAAINLLDSLQPIHRDMTIVLQTAHQLNTHNNDNETTQSSISKTIDSFSVVIYAS